MKLGEKLPKPPAKHFVMVHDLSSAERDRYFAFMSVYAEKMRLDGRQWTLNSMVLIPYESYEAWYQFEQEFEKE